jgi:hypothetical protein
LILRTSGIPVSHFFPMVIPEVICDNDDEKLVKIGYEQKLHRGMDGFMSFTIGFTEVSAIISVTSILSYGLTTGGPVTMIWGWIVTFFMTKSIAANFAEICSVFPCAGSVYHW